MAATPHSPNWTGSARQLHWVAEVLREPQADLSEWQHSVLSVHVQGGGYTELPLKHLWPGFMVSIDFLHIAHPGVVMRVHAMLDRVNESMSPVGYRVDASGKGDGSPEFRLPQNPLWSDHSDGLIAACDRDPGNRHVVADWLAENNLWDESDHLMRKAKEGWFEVDRPGEFIYHLRHQAVLRHLRQLGAWELLPLVESAKGGSTNY